jgi:type I restriction enzyme, S subunit
MKKGWATKKLGDVLEVQNGYAFDSEGFNPTKGMPLIRIRSLKPGTETETRFDGDYDKKYVVKAGDLLIGMDGEFGCYEWKGEPALLNQRVCRLQGFSGELVPRFLFYGVNDYLKAIEDVTGYATVKHISWKQILAIEFPVPPVAEQQRIVGLLDKAFAGLATAKANAERNVQSARALFQSHLQSVFTERGPQWVEKTVDQISTNLDSKRVPITKSDRKSGEFPYYGASGIVDYVADYIFDCDALLVSEDGANLLMRSMPIAFSVSGKYWVNNHAHILKFADMATQRFVEFYLASIKLDEYIRGAAQPKLTQAALNSIPIPIPRTVEGQAEIVQKLGALAVETQGLAKNYERKLAALEALKKSLLHEAFTGQL